MALTPFEAMCGFRHLEEIAILIKNRPEFAACISNEANLKVFLCSQEEKDKQAALRSHELSNRNVVSPAQGTAQTSPEGAKL